MNWFDGFNRVIGYIEEHLEAETDYQAMADIMGYSVYHFQRLFMMVAGTSVAEYIRCRRLSKAAAELLEGDDKILDIAMKYQYSSAGSFNRAFKAMHGMAPGDVRKGGATIKAYPPLSFEVTIKGAQTMDYRIIQMEAFRIVGRKLSTTIENGESYGRIPAFWGEMMQQGGPGPILGLMDSAPMGLLGVSDYNPDLDSSRFDYYIAVSSSKTAPDDMAVKEIPAASWAVFPCKEKAPDKMQEFQKQIVMDWLPASGYEFAKAPDIEVYDESGIAEMWLPIRKNHSAG